MLARSVMVCVCALLLQCGDDSNTSSSSGGTGGTSTTDSGGGGTTSSGGNASGGSSASGSGGQAAGTGGGTATGGTGGETAAGGTAGTGGTGGTKTGGTGGETAAGGSGGTAGAAGETAAGGTAGTGGEAPSGGASTGGTGDGGASTGGTGDGGVTTGGTGDGGASTGGSGDVAGAGGATDGTFTLTSPGWTDMEGCGPNTKTSCAPLPTEIIRSGAGTSPELQWTGAPEGTKTFVVLLQDLNNGTAHWILWNIPPTVTMLAANVDQTTATPATPAGSQQCGKGTDAGTSDGYYGPGAPCNVYEFVVYALSIETFSPTNATDEASVRTQLEALGSSILGTASLRGRTNQSC